MKLTKKELNNLYRFYSNGEFEADNRTIACSGTLFYVDKELVHKTMEKIRKLGIRKK